MSEYILPHVDGYLKLGQDFDCSDIHLCRQQPPHLAPVRPASPPSGRKPVGSGKSTTLASIVDFINQDRHDHIITLEDPIEYLIPSKNCHVNQREVQPSNTESFARALRGALREDPTTSRHHHGRLHLPRGRQNHHEILPGNQVTFNFDTLLLWLLSTNTSNTS